MMAPISQSMDTENILVSFAGASMFVCHLPPPSDYTDPITHIPAPDSPIDHDHPYS